MAKKKKSDDKAQEEARLTMIELASLLKQYELGDFDGVDDCLEMGKRLIKNDFSRKISSYLYVVAETKDEIERYEAYKDALSKRIKSLGSKIEFLKSSAHEAMKLLKVERLDGELPGFGMNIMEGKESVFVAEDDVEKLPKAYQVTTITPDKKGLMTALQGGQKIEGAKLKTGDPYITLQYPKKPDPKKKKDKSGDEEE